MVILYYYQFGGMLEWFLYVLFDIFLEELNFFQLMDDMQKENEVVVNCEDDDGGKDYEDEEEFLKNRIL